jgi:hypothetical protein
MTLSDNNLDYSSIEENPQDAGNRLVSREPLIADSALGAQEKKTNVVFILAVNVGYGDSYGGGELRGALTPNLDQMARDGLRLTQFLVEPAGTPSRAALMQSPNKRCVLRCESKFQNRSSLPRSEGSAFGENPTLGGRGQYCRS